MLRQGSGLRLCVAYVRVGREAEQLLFGRIRYVQRGGERSGRGGAGRQRRRSAHLRSHLKASRVMPCPRVSSFSFSYGWGTP